MSAISSNFTNIGTLTGSGIVNLGDKELRLNPTTSSSTFNGTIQGTEGSLTLVGNGSGNTVILTGINNTYTGTTLVTGSSGSLGTLEIGASGALSPQTNVVVENYGVFQLNPGTTNTALTLTSSGVVNNMSDPSTFTDISVTGGTFNNTGNTVLTFDSFDMTGGLLINGSSSLVDTSSMGSLTPADQGPFMITGGTIDNYSVFNLTTYTQGSEATLNMEFSLVSPANAPPLISCSGDATLDGTLNVIYNGTAPGSFASAYPLIESNHNIGSFATTSISGFGTTPPPVLIPTYSTLYLFFASTNAAWGLNGSGSWDIGSGDYVNWHPTGIPGVVAGNTTIVNFNDTPMGSAPDITVSLSDAAGTGPLAVTVYQMNFDSSIHSYTIEQYNSSSSITFATSSDSLNTQINVILGSHEIDAPILIDTGFANTGGDLYLTDGTQLTLGSNTTMTSGSTDGDYLEIFQGGAGHLGTGELANNGNLTPTAIYQYGATISNSGTINPDVYGIYPEEGDKAFFYNSGTGAVLGSTEAGYDGTTYIGYYGGTVEIVNSGTNATFGSSANDNIMLIGSDGYGGSTTITNSGYNSSFGPTGPNGYFYTYGDGTLSITNTGLGNLMGAFGNGAIVEATYGTIYNSSGAIFRAGPGGSLNIEGARIINDLRSVVGGTDQDVVLTSGLLNTSGSVLAFDYEQSGSGLLQMNLTTLPNVLGQVTADAAASLGGNLVVNALPGCNFPAGDVVDLITAQLGVNGTFTSVEYTGFPDTINPSITYLLNAVVLDVNPTVSASTSAGSIPAFSFISTNQNNFQVGRYISQLHGRLARKTQNQQTVARDAMETNLLASNSEGAIVAAKGAPLGSRETLRKETTEIHNKVVNRIPSRPWNFYMGPIDSVGTIGAKSSTQAGVSYNSIGALAGFDYALSRYGLGFSASYANTAGRVDHGGRLSLNGIHGSAYGIWTPENLDQLGISAILGGGYEWISVDRKAGPSPALTAHGSPNGAEFDALLGVEYIFSNRQFSAFPQHLQLTPLANLQYIGAWIDSYNETNGGQFALNVKNQSPNSLRSLSWR